MRKVSVYLLLPTYRDRKKKCPETKSHMGRVLDLPSEPQRDGVLYTDIHLRHISEVS